MSTKWNKNRPTVQFKSYHAPYIFLFKNWKRLLLGCSRNQYGENCTNCSDGCSKCDIDNGCVSCRERFTGINCQLCEPGYTGDNCGRVHFSYMYSCFIISSNQWTKLVLTVVVDPSFSRIHTRVTVHTFNKHAYM